MPFSDGTTHTHTYIHAHTQTNIHKHTQLARLMRGVRVSERKRYRENGLNILNLFPFSSRPPTY